MSPTPPAAGAPPVRTWSEMPSAGPRGAARAAALWSLAAASSVTGRTARGLSRPRIHFLYLHHVFADEETAFRRLVGHLAADHTLIGYSEAVDRVLEGRIDGPYVCFSFDDGVKSCLRAAAILEEFGARGCFFLLPGIVGERDPGALARFCADRLRSPTFDFMDWDDVERLQAAGHEVGSHTIDHPCVAELSQDAMHEQIEGAKQRLEVRCGSVTHFSWPFGGFEHFHPNAARIVFDAGHRSCTSAVRGCHVEAPPGPRALCLRRENAFARWPLAHIDWFLARSALRAGPADNRWPDGWAV